MRKRILLVALLAAALLTMFLLTPAVHARDSGIIRQLWSETKATTGAYSKIVAVFENTGTTLVVAYFNGSVYLEENPIEFLESDRMAVQPGETAELPIYFRANSSGVYTIKGNVIYGDAATNMVGILMEISPSGNWTDKITPLEISIYSFIVVGIVLGLMVFLARVKRKYPAEELGPPLRAQAKSPPLLFYPPDCE